MQAFEIRERSSRKLKKVHDNYLNGLYALQSLIGLKIEEDGMGRALGYCGEGQ
jgi:hypothetical protein